MHEVAVEEAFLKGGGGGGGGWSLLAPTPLRNIVPLMVLRILHCNNYHPWDYNWFQADVVHLVFS